MSNRSFLDHSQPSNIEVAGDVLLIASAVLCGAVAGIGILAKQTIEGWIK